jgi:hypothetical protein
MTIVAIAALNLAAIRTASDSSSGPEGLLCMVGLPMANVLAMVLLIGHRHRGRRRWLVGFEVFGVGMLAYLIVAILSDENWVWSYITLVLEPTRAIVRPTGGGNWSTIRLLVGRSVLSVWATVPQLAFAMLGGFLFHGFGTTDRRDHTGCS